MYDDLAIPPLITSSVINLEIENLIGERKAGNEDRNADMNEFKKTLEEYGKGKRGKW